MKEGNEHKVVFITPKGLFEPLVMFFRLCNAPLTFQANMNETFGDFINEGWLLAYLDNTMIMSETDEEDEECT